MAARARAGFGANLAEHSFPREGAKFARVSRGSILCELRPPRRRRPNECRRELDAAVGNGLALRSIKFRLYLDRVAHGIDRVAEFDENAVVRALDDAPMMRGNGGVDQIAAEAANAAPVLSSSRPATCSRRRRVTRVAATAQVSGFQGRRMTGPR
jgi:hypothetical protein